MRFGQKLYTRGYPIKLTIDIEAPDEAFFEEALSVTPVTVRPGFRGSLYMPTSLFRAAGITGSSFYIQVSLFSDGDDPFDLDAINRVTSETWDVYRN